MLQIRKHASFRLIEPRQKVYVVSVTPSRSRWCDERFLTATYQPRAETQPVLLTFIHWTTARMAAHPVLKQLPDLEPGAVSIRVMEAREAACMAFDHLHMDLVVAHRCASHTNDEWTIGYAKRGCSSLADVAWTWPTPMSEDDWE